MLRNILIANQHIVIASAAKQSRGSLAALDCHVAPLLAMTAPGMRNFGEELV